MLKDSKIDTRLNAHNEVFMWIGSHLLKKSLMENFISRGMIDVSSFCYPFC